MKQVFSYSTIPWWLQISHCMHYVVISASASVKQIGEIGSIESMSLRSSQRVSDVSVFLGCLGVSHRSNQEAKCEAGTIEKNHHGASGCCFLAS